MGSHFGVAFKRFEKGVGGVGKEAGWCIVRRDGASSSSLPLAPMGRAKPSQA